MIIAHPEPYRAIQEDVEVARGLVKMGCKLQASADFIAGGRMGAERKPAKRLFDENLYAYIASDAHRVSTTATSPKRSGRTEREERMCGCRFGLTASCR